MKIGTERHPKTKLLAKLLHKRIPECLGYLELLWAGTLESCPQGDVGRYGTEWIEARCMWPHRSGALAAALLEAGWLDKVDRKDGTFLLVTHDWHEHCPDFLRRRLQNAGKVFLSVLPNQEDSAKTTEPLSANEDKRTKDERTNGQTDQGTTESGDERPSPAPASPSGSSPSPSRPFVPNVELVMEARERMQATFNRVMGMKRDQPDDTLASRVLCILHGRGFPVRETIRAICADIETKKPKLRGYGYWEGVAEKWEGGL